MRLDKGTTADTGGILRNRTIQIAAAVALILLVGVLAVRALATTPARPAPAPAPAATQPGPALPGHDHHPAENGPPAKAWAVTIMFLDGIRTQDPDERARILAETATAEYADGVANIAEWHLPRGTIQSIEPGGSHTFRVALRAENEHPNDYQPDPWVTTTWHVTLTEDPFTETQWRVSALTQDHSR